MHKFLDVYATHILNMQVTHKFLNIQITQVLDVQITYSTYTSDIPVTATHCSIWLRFGPRSVSLGLKWLELKVVYVPPSS